jgi:hypothetical protein
MEKISASSRKAQHMADYVGDTRKRDQLRNYFRENFYHEVVELARALTYPNLMTQSEQKMVAIARKRTTAS